MQNLVLRNRRGEPFIDLNPVVFFVAVALIVLFVVVTIANVDIAEEVFSAVQGTIATYTGWFFVLAVNALLIFMFVLLFTRFGHIRLGGSEARPEFSYIGWFAMLFSAGMGIGLVFYGVAEPILHYVDPPLSPHNAEAETVLAAQDAMGIAYLHWGLHAWAIYAFVALCLAFFGFNRGLPLSIRSVFYPVLGERIYDWPGHVIDILATLATLFGVATSLGLGVQQVNGGLNYLFGLEQGLPVQIVLIAIITAIATVSVVSGLDKGIRRISETNMVIAGLLLLFVLLVGPTLLLLNGFVENLGFYLQNFPTLATWTETYTQTQWQNDWTVFYWGWWIAWSPFVGMFIARVSYGRTIREFIASVLFVPTLVTFVWLTIFGDSALQIEMMGEGGIAAVAQEDVARSLFAFLDHLPLAVITSLLATLVVITFFVTSSDSGSLVIDIITAGGKANPPTTQRVFWAVSEGIVAAVLLIGGGLTALQTAAITTGFPFGILLLIMGYTLIKGMQHYVYQQGVDLRPWQERGVPLGTEREYGPNSSEPRE
ncbi:BCCT family transporter [Thiohalorhabdus denitrificans]|uniref:Choline/glycine/proline betaine transport protein n=1 Tax=Thiohalorhabdus denitrificans TaxID=381306 RepID=A0A1G5BTR0_9GAMM|nr:BCCT family transporter [Thiohalorhabdus denitrificans]SCX93625.1 choline/glycine/proline betaine transport protein [Thiohalorhabdus denitrificans]